MTPDATTTAVAVALISTVGLKLMERFLARGAWRDTELTAWRTDQQARIKTLEGEVIELRAARDECIQGRQEVLVKLAALTRRMNGGTE